MRNAVTGLMVPLFFSLSALILYIFIYKTKVVPRYIAIWGFIAVVLIFFINVVHIEGNIIIIFAFPIILNELYLGSYLIIKGFQVEKVDLYKSDSDKFIVTEKGLLPPLRSLQGVGENAARSIVAVRGNSEIMSKDDLRKRAKVTKTVIETLSGHGCLEGLSETNQLSIFDFT